MQVFKGGLNSKPLISGASLVGKPYQYGTHLLEMNGAWTCTGEMNCTQNLQQQSWFFPLLFELVTRDATVLYS